MIESLRSRSGSLSFSDTACGAMVAEIAPQAVSLNNSECFASVMQPQAVSLNDKVRFGRDVF
jgi:hypothetical protein